MILPQSTVCICWMFEQKKSALGVLWLSSSSSLYIVYAYCRCLSPFRLLSFLDTRKPKVSHVRFKTRWSACNFIDAATGSPSHFVATSLFVRLHHYKQVDDEHTFAEVNCRSHFTPLCFMRAEKKRKNHTRCLEDLSFEWSYVHDDILSLRYLKTDDTVRPQW